MAGFKGWIQSLRILPNKRSWKPGNYSWNDQEHYCVFECVFGSATMKDRPRWFLSYLVAPERNR